MSKVKCSVDSCCHNAFNCCSLEELDISCTCRGSRCQDKKDTICKSFKEK